MKGIKTKLLETVDESRTDLYGYIASRFYWGRAPENFTLPLGIAETIEVDDPMLDQKQVRIDLTLRFYASSGETCDDIAKAARELYRDCEIVRNGWAALSVTGYTVMNVIYRQTIGPKYNYDNKQWEAYVIFELLLKEN